MVEYVYSDDSEYFYESDDFYDIIEDNALIDTSTIYRGIKKPLSHSDFINGGLIIENMVEACYDEIGESAEDYLSEINHPPEIKELEELISEWIERKTGSIKFYGVTDIKEITVAEFYKLNE